MKSVRNPYIAIIAAASALGCRELYTEDLTHGRDVRGVRIIDPFR